MYELHILRLTKQVFGLSKALIFLSGLPLVLITSKNRTAYWMMGECKAKIEDRIVVFRHIDVRFLDEIVIRRCYNPSQFVDIAEDSVVIDAGANIGIFTLYAGIRAMNGRVYSIEPERTNFLLLKENIEANNLSNVHLINAALSDVSGNIKLFTSNPGSNSIIQPFRSNANFQLCKSITMEDLLQSLSIDHVDILKMDVEGAEYGIFTKSSWLSKVKNIVMEVHPALGDRKNLITTLRNAGFHIFERESYDEDTIYLYAVRN